MMDKQIGFPKMAPHAVTFVPTDKLEIDMYYEDASGRRGLGLKDQPDGSVRHVLVFENEAAARCLLHVLIELLNGTRPHSTR